MSGGHTIRRMGRPLLAALPLLLTIAPAFASQGPGVADGTAEPMVQAAAAALALFPPVAVAVFALARLLGSGR